MTFDLTLGDLFFLLMTFFILMEMHVCFYVKYFLKGSLAKWFPSRDDEAFRFISKSRTLDVPQKGNRLTSGPSAFGCAACEKIS